MPESAGRQVAAGLADLVDEIEALLAESADEGSEKVREWRASARTRLRGVREQLADVEQDLLHEVKRGARRAGRYVRENPWAAVAAAAALAFALGCAVSHRDDD